MKTIIAGGRDYFLTDDDIKFLNTLNITEVVSGCARGADEGGINYALSNNIKLTRFPALWDKYGKSAGPIRNKEMAEYAEAVVLFPGGKGTNSMYNEARKEGLRIFDLRFRYV